MEQKQFDAEKMATNKNAVYRAWGLLAAMIMKHDFGVGRTYGGPPHKFRCSAWGSGQPFTSPLEADTLIEGVLKAAECYGYDISVEASTEEIDRAQLEHELQDWKKSAKEVQDEYDWLIRVVCLCDCKDPVIDVVDGNAEGTVTIVKCQSCGKIFESKVSEITKQYEADIAAKDIIAGTTEEPKQTELEVHSGEIFNNSGFDELY